jgi:hypothetical protein
MTNPHEQFTELTRRTQENFKHLWEQWSQRGVRRCWCSRTAFAPPVRPRVTQ